MPKFSSRSLEIFHGTCRSLSYLGLGEVPYGDKLVYVPDFYPGEAGEISIDYKRNGQFFGSVRSLEKPSSNRIPSLCPYFGACGGCLFQDYSYAAELQHKQRLIQNQLHRLAGVDVDVLPTLGMEEPLHYRNKIQTHFGLSSTMKPTLGFYRQGSHEVISISDCRIQDQRAKPILETVLQLVSELRIPVYREEKKQGYLRHFLIRTSWKKEEILAVLVTKQKDFPYKTEFVSRFRAALPQVTTLVQSIRKQDDNVILGDQEEILYGPGYIEDELCGLTFRISAKSFYQTNPLMTEVLYQTAISFADLTGEEVVLDAYSGIGTIGLLAAKHAKKVLSVESVPEAVKDAKENAERNGIHHFEEVVDDATHYLQQMAARKALLDVLFMDPPRKGSTPEFLEAAKQLRPKRIIYVSCGPSSLARDIKLLLDIYQIEMVQPVDLFPRTEHVETVVSLRLKD